MRLWDEKTKLYLLTPSEFEQLPDGVVLTCIDDSTVVKGKDHIDDDTRFGYLAFGIIDPMSHPEAELFTKFMLSQ